jgi:hypothetical protein
VSAQDFDFLHRSWRIAHRYLTERLAGCGEWITFESTMRCWPILGGAANIDEGYFPSRGFHGMTIRLYDKDADTWSLYWIDSRFARIESAGDRPVRRWRGDIPRAGHAQRSSGRVPVYLVGHHARLGALGPSAVH